MTANEIDFVITGAGGQLGREFCEHFDLYGISYKGFTSASLDITNHSEIQNVLSHFRPKVVLNCAAYTKVDQAEDDTFACYSVNDTAVAHLAEACKAAGSVLVHFSTDYVFAGERADKDKYPEGYTPDIEGNPTGTYARSKWEGEQRIRNSDCDFIIVRVSWLCGRFGHNFVKTMLRLGKEKESLNVVNDQYGSPSFTEPVVLQTLALIQKQCRGTYHITSDGIISWNELAREVMMIADLGCRIDPVPTSGYPTRARRPLFSKLDSSATVACTGQPMGDWKFHLNQLIQSLGPLDAAN
jgi:dTDP-4-dehydrorhamnose reductase